MLAGQPDDPTYAADADALFTVMREESASEKFTAKELNHRRGRFPAINVGFTMPNGFREPINLDTSDHQRTVDRIREHSGFKRISAYHNGSVRPPIPDSAQHLTTPFQRHLLSGTPVYTPTIGSGCRGYVRKCHTSERTRQKPFFLPPPSTSATYARSSTGTPRTVRSAGVLSPPLGPLTPRKGATSFSVI
jgi:hypothetical protein